MNIRNFTAAFVLLLAGLFLFASCGKDDDLLSDVITNNITKGTWSITNFDDSLEDKKENFAGFNFTFNSNGTVTASNGALTYAGTWSITDGDENNNVLDDLDFNIFFPQTNDFQDLNDDWDIESQSSDKLNLIEVSGIADTDLLTFQKN